MPLDKDQLLFAYRRILEIRLLEAALSDLLKRGEIPDLYPCSGQEAVAVGTCLALRPDDQIISMYRCLGHVMAKGAEPERVAAEFFGRRDGYCKGKGGAKHVTSFAHGIYGATSIVAAGIPHAAGVALANQYLGTEQVAVCFFGDGAANQGTFHEGLNLAAVWNLPVVFVCENNLYALATPLEETTAVKDIAERAAAYRLPGRIVDGMDVEAVFQAVSEAVDRARSGGGPSLLECKTYRFGGHFAAEFALKIHYRSTDEMDQWKRRDPILLVAERLEREHGFGPNEAEALRREVQEKIDAAVEFARKSPPPRPEEALEDLYASTYPDLPEREIF